MAFEDVFCVEDEVTQLAVCQVESSAVSKLHASIRRISAYLEFHHLAVKDEFDVPYHYRENYLPDKITGNDVTAINRAIAEGKARALYIAPVLHPLDSIGYTPVVSDDVAYVAENTLELAAALDTLIIKIQEYDDLHGRFPRWLIVLGVVTGVATLGAIVVGRRKK